MRSTVDSQSDVSRTGSPVVLDCWSVVSSCVVSGMEVDTSVDSKVEEIGVRVDEKLGSGIEVGTAVGSKVDGIGVSEDVETLGSVVEVNWEGDWVEKADVEVVEVTVWVLRQRLLREVLSESDSPSSSVFNQS